MKFRKKPVVIEAVEETEFRNADTRIPSWYWKAFAEGKLDFKPDHTVIHTLEGPMRCEFGDWIIRGVKGELYPCKPDIFVMTYEPVEV